jgi:MFS family permease
LYIVVGGAFANFYLLLPVVPLLGAKHGSDFDAGLLTFVFMTATVLSQMTVPRLLRTASSRTILGAGVLLMALPSFGYAPSQQVTWIAAISAVRGIGFGLMTVVSSTLVTSMAARERRGRSVGAYGLLSSSLGIFCPALGVWLEHSVGAGAISVAAAVVATVPALALVGMQAPSPDPSPTVHRGEWTAVWRAERLPFILTLLAGITITAIYSFLALRIGAGADVALLAFGVAFAAARISLGHLVDRHWNVGRLLVISSLLGASGAAVLAFRSQLVVACIASAAVGLGAGGLLTCNLLRMVERAGEGRVALGATLWNMAYDGGSAFGGVALGALLGPFGLVGIFAATALFLCPVGVALAACDRG